MFDQPICMQDILEKVSSSKTMIANGDFPAARKLLESLEEELSIMIAEATSVKPLVTASPDIVFRVVAKYTKTPIHKIRGKSHLRTVVTARHITKYLLRKHTTFSLTEIGSMFPPGVNSKPTRVGQDHTTVIHSLRAIQGWMKTEPNTCAIVNLCDHKITEYCLKKMRNENAEELLDHEEL